MYLDSLNMKIEVALASRRRSLWFAFTIHTQNIKGYLIKNKIQYLIEP